MFGPLNSSHQLAVQFTEPVGLIGTPVHCAAENEEASKTNARIGNSRLSILVLDKNDSLGNLT
jgi:hypothetical protein